MNILFDINHPGHVHLFKNAIGILISQGHHIIIVARDKDVTKKLLENYNLEFHLLSKARKGILGLGLELLIRQWKLIPILLKNKIQLCVSVTGATCVHIAGILGIPTVVFYDTEHATLQNALTIPFATKYITPKYYKGKHSRNQTTYAGIHELAYLHPKYFTPDASILELLQIDQNQKFVIVRFVAWEASHDVGKRGLSLEAKKRIIDEISKTARVFIIPEGKLDDRFKAFQISLPPERAHDLLYYASLYLGEGATMASECACVGTPAIYTNPLKLGYIEEEVKFGLVFDLEKEEDIIKKSLELLNQDKNRWRQKSSEFIGSHIDVTEYMVEMIRKHAKAKNKDEK